MCSLLSDTKWSNRILVELYETTKTLQRLVGFKLKYPKRDENSRDRGPLDFPEVQLVVLLVISTKLLFPFDDIKRYPTTSGEPSTQVMDWPTWAQAQRRFENHPEADGRLSNETAIQLTDKDVFHMDPERLDQYMDWYETSWLSNSRSLHPVADMFPTGRTGSEIPRESEMAVDPAATDPGEALKTLLQTVMESLKPAPVASTPAADSVRPGSWYRRYRWESQLPEAARVFYNLAAQVASISLPTLIRAVSNTEWRISKWLENQRRTRYIEQWDREDDEGDGEDEVDELDEQLHNFEVGEEYGIK